jgi:hypothetical protein
MQSLGFSQANAHRPNDSRTLNAAKQGSCTPEGVCGRRSPSGVYLEHESESWRAAVPLPSVLLGLLLPPRGRLAVCRDCICSEFWCLRATKGRLFAGSSFRVGVLCRTHDQPIPSRSRLIPSLPPSKIRRRDLRKTQLNRRNPQMLRHFGIQSFPQRRILLRTTPQHDILSPRGKWQAFRLSRAFRIGRSFSSPSK